MRRLLYIFIISAIVATSSCGRGGDGRGRGDDSTALRLAVMPTMDCLPLYYADSVGLFDSMGVSVRLVTFDAAMDADTAFRRGAVDGIVTDLVKMCRWQDEGDSLTAIMAADLSLWLVTAQSARIMKEASLKDKIIAVTRHSAEDFMADRIMEMAGMRSEELNKPQINNLRLRTLMVDQNQVDGALLPEPFASEAVARGARRLAGTAALRLPGMMTVLMADSVAKARSAEMKGIVDAYNRAVELIAADTALRHLSLMPAEHCVYLPDTLYKPMLYKRAAQVSDSMAQVVKAWWGEQKSMFKNK